MSSKLYRTRPNLKHVFVSFVRLISPENMTTDSLKGLRSEKITIAYIEYGISMTVKVRDMARSCAFVSAMPVMIPWIIKTNIGIYRIVLTKFMTKLAILAKTFSICEVFSISDPYFMRRSTTPNMRISRRMHAIRSPVCALG